LAFPDALGVGSGGFLEFDLGGVAEGVGKVETRNEKLEIRKQIVEGRTQKAGVGKLKVRTPEALWQKKSQRPRWNWSSTATARR
jgi:hypothetical protein